MILWLIFLLLCGIVGHRIARRVAMKRNAAEHAALAMVMGLSSVSLVVYGASYFLHRTRSGLILGLMMTAFIVGAEILFSKIKKRDTSIEWQIVDRIDWGIYAVIILFVCFFFAWCVFAPKDDSLVMTFSAWGDNLVHLSIASSFAYADNYPPEYPNIAGHPMKYYFMMDYISGILLNAGTGIQTSFVIPLVAYGVSLLVLMYGVARRISSKRVVAIVCIILLVCFSSLGVLRLIFDWNSSAPEGLRSIMHTSYSLYPEMGLHRMELLELMASQRPIAAGFALAAVIMFLLLGTEVLSVGRLAVIGLAAGLLPWFHVHVFLFMIMCLFFFYLGQETRRRIAYEKIPWLLVPLILFGLLKVLQVAEASSSGGFLKFHVGWLVEPLTVSSFLSFWLLNYGVMIVLIVFAWRRMPWWLLAACISCVGIINLVQMQPSLWDNHKLLDTAVLFCTPFVALFLMDVRGLVKKTVAITLIVILSVSGAQSIGSALMTRAVIITPYDADVGRWLDEILPKDAIVIAAPQNSPVNMIAGRSIYLGYPGQVWSHGVDYGGRLTQIRQLAQVTSREDFCSVWNKTGATHMMVSTAERSGTIDLVTGIPAASPSLANQFAEQFYLNQGWDTAAFGDGYNRVIIFRPRCA